MWNMCVGWPGSGVGARPAAGVGAGWSRLGPGGLWGAGAWARWGPPSAAGVTAGPTASVTTGRRWGREHHIVGQLGSDFIPQQVGTVRGAVNRMNTAIATWKLGQTHTKWSSPVAFLLSFFPPGSHLGPEELIKSVLLPAFTGREINTARWRLRTENSCTTQKLLNRSATNRTHVRVLEQQTEELRIKHVLTLYLNCLM